MTYDTTGATLSAQNGHSDMHAHKLKMIREVVNEYDGEIVRLEKNAKTAFYGMMASLVLCIFIFIIPSVFPKYNSNMQAAKYPALVQDTINQLADIQKGYYNKIEYNQKRFNDIRQLQDKFGPELENTYFANYEDDPIFSNLLFTSINGAGDTSAKGKKLIFGGEIPFSPAHSPLNNKLVYIKLSKKDTLQDRNFEMMKSGIFMLEKNVMDSIGVLSNRRDQLVVSHNDGSDNLSIRAGAIIFLIISISVLAYMQRYFHQMKHFYLSRRNVLKLMSLGNSELHSVGIDGLLKSLSSDHIEMKLPSMRSAKE